MPDMAGLIDPAWGELEWSEDHHYGEVFHHASQLLLNPPRFYYSSKSWKHPRIHLIREVFLTTFDHILPSGERLVNPPRIIAEPECGGENASAQPEFLYELPEGAGICRTCAESLMMRKMKKEVSEGASILEFHKETITMLERAGY